MIKFSIGKLLTKMGTIFLICMNFTEYSCNSLQIRNICLVFDTKNMTFTKVGNYFLPKSELVSQIFHYL